MGGLLLPGWLMSQTLTQPCMMETATQTTSANTGVQFVQTQIIEKHEPQVVDKYL